MGGRPVTNPGPYDMKSVPGGRFSYTITCSDCGATQTCEHMKFSPSTAKSVLPRKFAERGWHVHPHKRKHLCATCLHHTGETSTPEPESTPDMSKAANANVLPQSHLRVPLPLGTPTSLSATTRSVGSESVAVPTEPIPELATAQPPRQPSIEERRIINGKLLDLYADKGYSSGWSDERLAKDLGVPRAWVAQVREFSFGPDIDEDAAAAETAADKALKYAEKAHTDLTALADRVIDDIKERVTASQALVDEARRLVALRKTPR